MLGQRSCADGRLGGWCMVGGTAAREGRKGGPGAAASKPAPPAAAVVQWPSCFLPACWLPISRPPASKPPKPLVQRLRERIRLVGVMSSYLGCRPEADPPKPQCGHFSLY